MEDIGFIEKLYRKKFQKKLESDVIEVVKNYRPYQEKEIEYNDKLITKSNRIVITMDKNAIYYYPVKILENFYRSRISSPAHLRKIIEHTNAEELKLVMGMFKSDIRIPIYRKMTGDIADTIALYIINYEATEKDDNKVYKAAIRCIDTIAELIEAKETSPPLDPEIYGIFAHYCKKDKYDILIDKMKVIIDRESINQESFN